MEISEIGKMCLNCMHMSKEDEFCPVCGKPKRAGKSYGRALEPGTVLNGKILIGNILGMGNFGITYMGFDMLLEYRVAVKEFFPDEMVQREEDGSLSVSDESTEEEYREELKAYQREARTLAQFSKYPGIVSIKELFYENNTAYIVMEYLEGGTLRRFIDNNGGRLPVEKALSLMEPVITSMEEIHKSGLIHRDISPENIMLDADGSIKVIDFGATKKLSNRTSQVYFGKFGYDYEGSRDGMQRPSAGYGSASQISLRSADGFSRSSRQGYSGFLPSVRCIDAVR
ncbi:MAG: serine/threonine protein kinase [Lachnospiraceae bacterium]|nr:serine/threonine protein kinase [Lachnospiraceae bacterium]